MTEEITGAALAKAILTQIEEHPKQFNMGSWIATGKDCGTTACVAGWAVLLNGATVISDAWDGESIDIEASRLLDIPNEDYSDLLFRTDEQTAIAWLEMYVENDGIPGYDEFWMGW